MQTLENSNKRLNSQRGFIGILIPVALVLIIAALAFVFLGAIFQTAQKSCGIVKLVNVITLGTVGPVKDFTNLCDRLGTLESGAGRVSCSESSMVPAAFKPYIKEAASKWLDGDEAKLIALFEVESTKKNGAWDPNSYNEESGASGLGQFVSKTASGWPEFIGGNDTKSKDWPIPTFKPKNPYEPGSPICAKDHLSECAPPEDKVCLTDEDCPGVDPRFIVERMIHAAAHKISNDIKTEKKDTLSDGTVYINNNFRKAYEYIYNAGRYYAKDDIKYTRAVKAGEKLERIYNDLISGKSAGCTVIPDSETDGVFVQYSGVVANYSDSIEAAPGYKPVMLFDSALGDALVLAIAEAKEVGISVSVISGKREGPASTSRHNTARAVDIYASKNGRNICFRDSFKSGGCDDELERIMASHGMINLCYPFSGYPNGDCNHFQLADETVAERWSKANPGSSLWSESIPASGVVSLGPCKTGFRNDEEAKRYMTTITVDVWGENRKVVKKQITIQKCMEDKFKKAFASAFADPEKFPIKSIGGYNYRKIAGKNVLSSHATGIAVDINPDENAHIIKGKVSVGKFYKPCPANGCSPYSMPENGSVVRAFNNQGFGWGGNWDSSKDYMHFSCSKNEGGRCF